MRSFLFLILFICGSSFARPLVPWPVSPWASTPCSPIIDGDSDRSSCFVPTESRRCNDTVRGRHFFQNDLLVNAHLLNIHVVLFDSLSMHVHQSLLPRPGHGFESCEAARSAVDRGLLSLEALDLSGKGFDVPATSHSIWTRDGVCNRFDDYRIRSHSCDPTGFVLIIDNVTMGSRVFWGACGETFEMCQCGHPDSSLDNQREVSNALYTQLYGAYVVPPRMWANAFYHKLAEEMTSLVQAYALLEADPSVRVLVSDSDYDKLPHYLALLGIPSKRTVTLSEATHDQRRYLIERAYITSGHVCGMAAWPRMRQVRDLFHAYNRETVLTGLLPPDTHNGTRGMIVLLDRKGHSRQVPGFEQISEYLSKHHPRETVLVHTAETSADDSLRMMYQAKIVIGGHGAGMAHLLMVHDRVRVLEITPLHLPQKKYNPCFYWMAGAFNASYWIHALDGGEGRYYETLDLSKIQPILEQMLTYP